MNKRRSKYQRERTDPEDLLNPVIPLNWFMEYHYLSPGQALSLFIVEKLGLSFLDAAGYLGKDETTIRRAFHLAQEKRTAHGAAELEKKEQAKAKRRTTGGSDSKRMIRRKQENANSAE